MFRDLTFRKNALKPFVPLHPKNAHIVGLQETHFTTQSIPKFFSKNYSQVFMALASTKQCGVLIAFHRNTPFSLIKEIEDPEGRYLILKGHLLDTAITIVSYYAPNKQPNSFLSHLLQKIDYHKIGTVILCGDSNQTIFPFLDKSPIPQTQRSDKQSFSKLIAKHNLVDSWCELNPTKR